MEIWQKCSKSHIKIVQRTLKFKSDSSKFVKTLLKDFNTLYLNFGAQETTKIKEIHKSHLKMI